MLTNKIKIFNLNIDDLSFLKYISLIERSIKDKKKISICYTNAHVARLSEKDLTLSRTLNCFEINYADGFGLTIASKFINGYELKRFTLTEYALDVLKICANNGWKIFLLGGEQKFINGAVFNLRKLYPNLTISGYLNGYDQLNMNTVEIINNSNADILWVGLGTPKQEYWVHKHRENLNCYVVNCVGDLYSALAGKRLRGPKILRDLGFEWLFRLIQHPFRYFNRYVIGIPYFLFLIIKYKIKKS